MPGTKGRSGPRRKPDALKIAEHTYRKDRDGKPQDKPQPTGKPRRPRGMKGEARKFWDRFIPKLIDMGVATDADECALIAMSEYWGEYREAEAVTRRDAAFDKWEKLARLFGMNPSDRSRMRIEPAKKQGVRKRQA